MDALSLLHNRNSMPQLQAPGPDKTQLEDILKAALRAPDHAWLRPWRFLVIEGEGLHELGELFVTAACNQHGELDEAKKEKMRRKPLRAPLIITVIACFQKHHKIPRDEQLIAAGCAAHGLILAAHALGFGAMWRTGDNAEYPVVREGLGVTADEQIIGFIYLGTPANSYKPLPQMAVTDFYHSWP